MPPRPSPYARGNTRSPPRRPGHNDRRYRNIPAPSRPKQATDTPPLRNVLMITDLHELQYLAEPPQANRQAYRMLAPRYYTSCSGIEREALYTHTTLIPFSDLTHISIDNCLQWIADHLLITFRTPIDPGSIELRFSDITGDVFQVPRDRTILELLEEDRPMWRTHQPGFFASTPLPDDIDYPFIARFSCHVHDPRVILP